MLGMIGIMLFDAVLRPVVATLIIAFLPVYLIVSMLGFFVETIEPPPHQVWFWLAGYILAFGWFVWNIVELGLRQSFLYARMDDPLINSGPYRYHRHPQLLSALILIFTSIHIANPSLGEYTPALLFRYLNLLIMVIAVFVVIHFEEKDLQRRFGEKYAAYRKRLPGRIITLRAPSKVSRKKLISLALGSYIGATAIFITVVPSPFPGFKPLIPTFLSVGMNPRLDTYAGMFGPTQQELDRLGWDLGEWMRTQKSDKGTLLKDTENGAILSFIKGYIRENFDRYRSIKYSAYPQTLFFCDQVYYPPGNSTSFDRFPVVHQLPFPLLCNDEQVEIAQAVDYDGDGFPQVWVVSVPLNDKKDVICFRAADDETNTLHPRIRSRSK